MSVCSEEEDSLILRNLVRNEIKTMDHTKKLIILYLWPSRMVTNRAMITTIHAGDGKVTEVCQRRRKFYNFDKAGYTN
jgi:hypothetical protein